MILNKRINGRTLCPDNKYTEEDLAYRRLADAVVARAVMDFLSNAICEREFHNFVFSPWFAIYSDKEPSCLYFEIVNAKKNKDKKKLKKLKRYYRSLY